MKVYRLLSHLSLCALLLSCAMPALGSWVAETPEKQEAEKKRLTGLIEGDKKTLRSAKDQNNQRLYDNTQIHLEKLRQEYKRKFDTEFPGDITTLVIHTPGSVADLLDKVYAAKKARDDAETANPNDATAGEAEQDALDAALNSLKAADKNTYDEVIAKLRSPAAPKVAPKGDSSGIAALDPLATAMPVAQPAAPEGWMAWSGRIASAPFRAVGRGVMATGRGITSGVSTVAGYAAYPFVKAYSAVRGTSVEIPVSDKIQNALLKAKFADADLTRLQKEANAQIAANKKDTTVDPSAAVQAFLNAAQSHRPAKDILVRMLAPEAQKRIQAASDVYAKLRAKNASEAELDEAMQAMQEATEELELIRAGGVGLGGAVVSEEGQVLNAPEKEEPSVSYPINTFPEAAEETVPAVVRARPETPQAELAAVKSALSGQAYRPMSYRDYMAAERQARAQQPQRNARGALTGAGQMARLEQRLAGETARRIQNSMLANNSVPTAGNLDQWVREFVNMYESPYVMSKLTQSEKEQYIALIKEFFRKAQLSGDFNPNEVATLYDRLIQGSPRLQEAIQARLEPWMEQQAEAAEQEFDESRAQSDQASADRIAAEKKAAKNPSPANIAMVEQAKAAEQQAVTKTQSKLMKVLKWTAAAAIVGGATYLGVSWATGSDPKAVKENFSTLANWSYNHGGKLKEKIFGKKAPATEEELKAAANKNWTQTLTLGYFGNPATGQAPAAAAATATAPKQGWIDYGKSWFSWGKKAPAAAPKAAGSDISDEQVEKMLLGQEYASSPTTPAEESVAKEASAEVVAPSAPASTPSAERPAATRAPASAPAKAAAPAGRGMMATGMDIASKGQKAYNAYAAYKEAAKEAADLLTRGKDPAAVKTAAEELGIATGGKVPLRAKIQAYYQTHPWDIPANIVTSKGLPIVAPLAMSAAAASAK